MSTKRFESLIYGLVDPRDSMVHYIGTTSKLRQRLPAHEKVENWIHFSLAFVQWRIGLARSGYGPQFVVLDSCPQIRMYQREQEWIKKGFEKGWPLTNSNKDSTPEDREFRKALLREFITQDLVLRAEVRRVFRQE